MAALSSRVRRPIGCRRQLAGLACWKASKPIGSAAPRLQAVKPSPAALRLGHSVGLATRI